MLTKQHANFRTRFHPTHFTLFIHSTELIIARVHSHTVFRFTYSRTLNTCRHGVMRHRVARSVWNLFSSTVSLHGGSHDTVGLSIAHVQTAFARPHKRIQSRNSFW